LLPTESLISDTVYYAVQSIGACENGVRTAVKVFILENIVLDAPVIASPQELCGDELTIANIATDGNTNIVWYDAPTGGTKLELTETLENNTTYYAALAAGDCESELRTAVLVHLGTFTIATPDVATPQTFCEGALIANIAVPNNQIAWYLTAIGGEPLAATYVLQHDVTYYAALVAGECESQVRKAVDIELGTMSAPILASVQGICGKATLADLVVTGAGVVWFATETGTQPLPLTDSLEVGKTYWAAQTSVGLCASIRASVTITDSCYQVFGTIFPFVASGSTTFDDLFTVTVNLYAVPPMGTIDPIQTIIDSKPLYTTTATNYDGKVFVENTPKYPGEMGKAGNPGLPLDWSVVGKTPEMANNEVLLKDSVPTAPIGLYTFTNVKKGDYILEIYRPGFLIRWGKVSVDEHGMTLGHREILAGDITGDLWIEVSDISYLKALLGNTYTEGYDPKYDFNGDGTIDSRDLNFLLFNLDAFFGIYEETIDWAEQY